MLQRAETPVALTGVEASRSFFAPCFAGQQPERLWVAHVDEEARCTHLASYDDPLGGDGLPVSAIIGDAMKLGSAGIVLAHRDPDARSAPLPGELAATRALSLAAEAIDLVLIDHLLFADQTCSSYRRKGLL